MLGTNDLKARFSVGAFDIASGVGILLGQLARAEAGRSGRGPKALVICPPPILATFGDFEFFAEMFSGGREKSLRLRPCYEQMARETGATFLDAGNIITSSPYDGIHLDLEMQTKLGEAVAASIAILEIP